MDDAAFFARATWALLGDNERAVLSKVSGDSGVSLWGLYREGDVAGVRSAQLALDKLIELGLIVRLERDGRSRPIALTEYGKYLVKVNT